MTPNLVIIRIPDDTDGTKLFIALDYLGGKLGGSAQPFSVHEGDPYNDLRFDHVVIAEKIEEGSFDILRFIIDSPEGAATVKAHELDYEALSELADYMVGETKEVLAKAA